MTLKSTRYQKVMPAALNRRKVGRQKVNLSGTFVGRGGEVRIKATILDISIFGCRLELDAILPEGETVQIHLTNGEKIDAKVIWQKASEAGCRFEDSISLQKVKALMPSR